MPLQYWTPARGWWTGHKTFLPADPQAYVAGVNARPGFNCRILDDAGHVVAGDPTPCTECGGTHDGMDGTCLL